MQATTPRLVPAGLDLGHTTLPLHVASVHYWRLDREAWRPCLEAVRDLGFTVVDLYIPWAVHERELGRFDFGTGDRRLDVGAFLDLIAELGLYAIARPGPHINAELTHFGIPERILWSPPCQARSPRGNPVLLPMLPAAFPVPSYASDSFHREAAAYFAALGPLLAPRLAPAGGPIVLVQVDNEGALYFRDGAYEQDYHPDAIAHYRRFLEARYGSPEGLAAAYGTTPQAFDAVEPPRRFDAGDAAGLPRHLDWVEFHEELLAEAMRRFRAALEASGITGVPFTHNLPPGQDATPLNPARLRPAVDLVGLDYYHRADPLQRRLIARRTTELASRSEGLGVPVYAAELGAGFPPFFPALTETDSEFTLLTALAYGLRGFNLYMAVARDRWVGAPINSRGQARPSAAFYEKLLAALDRLRFGELRRPTPVRLLTPRSLRRLTRAMHAFGPITGTFFSVMGAGARERCLEDDLGFGGPIALEGEAFLHAFEEALEARGVPFAHVGGEDHDVALDGARWVLCATTGGLKPALLGHLRTLAASGVAVTLGPRRPDRDGTMRPLEGPADLGAIELLGPPAPSEADRRVARAIDTLGLPTYGSDPSALFCTVHEDAAGTPRAVFVLNPTTDDLVGRVGVASLPASARLVDALDGQSIERRSGVIELRVPPRTVRLLEVLA